MAVMNIGSASLLGFGQTGLQRGMENARQAGADIARQGTGLAGAGAEPGAGAGGAAPGADRARPLVGLRQAELQTQASARIVQAWDATLGTLLDVQA